MRERHKVLAAMLSGDLMTVPWLATFSGVNPHTVRTVLARERELVEEVDEEPTGGRGRPRKRYRLRPEQRERARGILKAEVAGMQDVQPLVATEGPTELPLSVIAAQEVLLESLPAAKTVEDRQAALARADTFLQDARSDIESDAVPEAGRATARASVEALEALGRSLKAADSGAGSPFLMSLPNLLGKLKDLLRLDPSSPVCRPILECACNLQQEMNARVRQLELVPPDVYVATAGRSEVAALQGRFPVHFSYLRDQPVVVVDAVDEEPDWLTLYIRELIQDSGGRTVSDIDPEGHPAQPPVCLVTLDSRRGYESALQAVRETRSACRSGKVVVIDTAENRALRKAVHAQGAEYRGSPLKINARSLQRMVGVKFALRK